MFELSLTAVDGRWVLEDDELGPIGAYDSQAEALIAIGETRSLADGDPQSVLVLDPDGEWYEFLVQPGRRH